MEEGKDFKHIVRIVNTDVDGNKPIRHALIKIKGVSFMFANMACKIAKVVPTTKSGVLKDEQVEKLNDIILNPTRYNAPVWMFNRRKDPETGEDKHVATADLRFNQENDIKMMKKIKCYKGVRHIFGLPARGQKTKSNFRKNKGKVTGVKRKAGAKTGKV